MIKTIKKLLLMTGSIFLLSPVMLWSEMATSVSRFGITWTFDKEYEIGQFVNGDWWVVGPVIIESVSPLPSSGRNGSELDPIPGTGQAYDSRSAQYVSSKAINFPLTMQPDESLISSISHGAGDCGSSNQHWLGYSGKCDRSGIKTSAVLTCVNSPVPPGTFRPPFGGGNYKPMHSYSAICWDLLPRLPVPSSAPDGASMLRHVERPWVDMYNSWQIQHGCHSYNMNCYGRNVGEIVSEIAAYLMLDTPVLEELTIRFIQLGIDNYGSLKNGARWSANGGHSSGRKWPIVFAGLMLNDDAMLRVGLDFPNNSFGEDGQTFYDDNGFPRWRGKASKEDDENSSYRFCCTSLVWAGQALAARIMRAEDVWNHNAFFDYVDRWLLEEEFSGNWWSGTEAYGGKLVEDMWKTYRNNLPPLKTCQQEPDVTSPTLSGISAVNISSQGAVIEWTTDENATSTVDYGISNFYGQTASTAGLTTSHSVQITGLQSDTDYHFRVRSTDLAGNETLSSDSTFKTLTPDVTAPTCTLVFPMDGENLSAFVTLIASASDNQEVVSVEFFLNDIALGTASSGNLSLFELQWNSYTVQNGNYNLRAIATDADGNQGVSNSISITVENILPDLTSGLIGFWNFNENNGTIANDSSPNGFDGVIDGATLDSGIIDDALSFSNGNHVDLGDFSIAGNELTLAAWVNPSAISTDSRIISKATGTSSTDIFWMLEIDDDVTGVHRLGFRLNSGGVYYRLTGGTVVLNQWTYVVGVYDGTTMRLYQDGIEVANQPKSGAVREGSADVWVGDNPPTSGSRSFEGIIDEVRVYNRTLNTLEINRLMDVSAPNLSGISVSGISLDSAVITWSTDENATSVVDYGTTSSYGQTTAASDLTTNHSVELTGLEESTSYYFRVRSADISSNEAISENLTFITTSSGNNNLNAGLFGYWNFDETGGSIARDVSSNGLDGSVEGATWASGKLNNALSFSNGNHVDLGDFSIAGNELTLAAWVNPSAIFTDPRIISKATGTSNTDIFWMLEIDDDVNGVHRLGFRLNSGGVYYRLTGGTVVLNQWTYVVGVYDGTTMRLYQDGVEIASQVQTGALREGLANVWVGGNPPDGQRGFEGLIDEVRVYNRALNIAEIISLREATIPSAPAGLQVISNP